MLRQWRITYNGNNRQWGNEIQLGIIDNEK